MSSIRFNIIASKYQVGCYKINPSSLDQAIIGIPTAKVWPNLKYCEFRFFYSDLIIVFLILDDNLTMSGLANWFTRIDRLRILLMALNHGYRPLLLSSSEKGGTEMFTSSIFVKSEYCKSNRSSQSWDKSLIIDFRYWKNITRPI